MLKTPKTKAGRFIRETLIVLTSAFFGSSVQIFVMIPNGMTSGGMPGIARLITHFLPVSYSLVYYTLSMVVLIVAWITMGKDEVKRIVALGFAYPIMLFIFEHIDYEFLSKPDPLLAALLIGAFYGIGTGIVYIGGYSSGGSDTLARVLKNTLFNYLRTGDIQMAIDVVIIVISAFVFDTNIAMYAIITAVVAAKVISLITVGYTGKFVQFDIITSSKEKADQITEFVLNDVNRAVTSHVSRGEYTHEERRTLTVICTPAESIKIKKYVAENDPESFATVMSLTNVWGKRFQD
ncbi:MAG: YitT family protein, partial [Lachnospiraceae bacterium]|nr:YitT family protein [Lachnospiraceae bacterium]